MDWKRTRRTDDEASSPGDPIVILLLIILLPVTITAGTATLQLDLAPDAEIEVAAVDPSTQMIRLEHHGGDPLVADRSRLVISNGSANLRVGPGRSEAVWRPGDHVQLRVNRSSPVRGWSLGAGSGELQLVPGEPYRLHLVDTRSDAIVFDRKLRIPRSNTTGWIP